MTKTSLTVTAIAEFESPDDICAVNFCEHTCVAPSTVSQPKCSLFVPDDVAKTYVLPDGSADLFEVGDDGDYKFELKCYFKNFPLFSPASTPY